MKGESMKKSKRMLKLIVIFIVVTLFMAVSIISVFAKETTLTVWCWEYQQKCINACLDEFYELYPDIKIKFEIMGPADVYDRLLLAISAGEGAPDVTGCENSHLAQFVALGGLYDITEKALPYYIKMESAKWIDAMDKEKRIYAMPWDSGPVAIWYRRDVFEKAGLASDPESVAKILNTWDDFYEVAKIIKEKTGSYMFAQAKANNDFRIYEILLWQQGAGYVDKEGKVVIDSPKAVNTLKYLGKFWKEDLVQDAVSWTPGWYAGIDEGKVATIIEGVWMGGFLSSWITPGSSGKWGVVPLPVWEKGGVRSSNDGGSTLAITKQCENKEAAWKFIEYITANREAQLIAWKEMDSFPSLLECYADSAMVEEEVAFFGGQKHRKVFVEAAKHIPWWNYTKDYAEMNSILQTYVTAYATGDITSAEEALTQIAAEIRMRTGRK
ncbi:MAG: sugar ABC transporter substrate-binding protein [Candidatus Atribacteria bacterium]|nr:sugar ABC transporter substrate-binding protein [Candidatus Atribacteria bacterium]